MAKNRSSLTSQKLFRPIKYNHTIYWTKSESYILPDCAKGTCSLNMMPMMPMHLAVMDVCNTLYNLLRNTTLPVLQPTRNSTSLRSLTYGGAKGVDCKLGQVDKGTLIE